VVTTEGNEVVVTLGLVTLQMLGMMSSQFQTPETPPQNPVKPPKTTYSQSYHYKYKHQKSLPNKENR
jgi:hypothetical protein